MAHRITRHHVSVTGRRVHYRRAGAGPPVLLLHESPRSSAALVPLMLQAPPGLTVLALDTPGNGLSDPLPQTAPSAFDYGDALAHTLTALGIGRAAVYGRHTGAAFACALALRHPGRVAGLVLDGLSAFSADERARWLPAYLPPLVPAADGSHMAWLWSRVRDQALFFPWHEPRMAHRLWQPLPTAAALHAVAMDLLSAGDAYRAPYSAAFTFDPAPVLPLLQMPAVVAARHSDVLLPHQARFYPSVPAWPAQVRLHQLPDDRVAVGAQVWQCLAAAAQGLADAPAALDAALPAAVLGDTLVGATGQRTHLRGATGGSGRPLVWLHPSPGGARGMDLHLRRELGQRPVLALDLPHHGESDAGPVDPPALLDHLQVLLRSLDLADAELQGEGLGAALACAAARQLQGAAAPPAPQRLAVGAPTSPDLPEPCPPRPDGGHLFAAWQHARDEALLGPWWGRATQPRFDCGDGINLAAVQARALEFLKEGQGAAALRVQWVQWQAGSHGRHRPSTVPLLWLE